MLPYCPHELGHFEKMNFVFCVCASENQTGSECPSLVFGHVVKFRHYYHQLAQNDYFRVCGNFYIFWRGVSRGLDSYLGSHGWT